MIVYTNYKYTDGNSSSNNNENIFDRYCDYYYYHY